MASTSVNTNTAASGATNESVATETINSTEKAQRIKIALGASGVDDGNLQAKALDAGLAASDKGVIVQSVIHGKSSAGGGTYVDVKVTPSGAVLSDTSGSTTVIDATSVDQSPGYGRQDQGGGSPGVDQYGRLVTRAQILTDESTFRCNFANTSTAVALGSGTFTNGGLTVTGLTLTSTTDLHAGDYIKADSDPESAWAQIASIDSGTQVTLENTYSGASVSGACSRSLVRPFTGTGGSQSVSSGQLTFTSGTVDNDSTGIDRFVDYAPLIFRSRVSISQRIANQAIHIGLEEITEPARWFARFVADGTTNTTIKCQTGRNPTTAPSAAETEESIVTLPNAVTTATINEFRIEQLTEQVKFFINGKEVATHTRSIPSQHDEMRAHVEVRNGVTIGSSTSVAVDYLTCKNHNKIEVGLLSDSEQVLSFPPDLARASFNVAGVIAINTVLVQMDCAKFKSITWQCTSMGTTGAVTPEWSLDGVTWVGDTFFTAAGASATTFNAAGLWFTNVKARYFRLRLSTATTAGTTTIFADGCMIRQQVFFASQTVTASNLSTNMAQAGGQTVIIIQPNGSTNRAIVSGMAGPTTNTDYSAQAWAAASGSGATIANAQGLGVSAAFDVNVTAWTAGSSLGLTVYLQESPDNGTTWYDIWQCVELAAVGRDRIPAIPVGGRRRMRWVNRGGAATTATVTVTAMDCSGVMLRQVQWYDRTSGVGNGTAVLNTNSAAYDVSGCNAVTVVVNAGTATAVGSFQVQRSNDGTNWFAAGTATAISATTANMTVLDVTANRASRFLRVTCTAAGTTQVINSISIYGTN